MIFREKDISFFAKKYDGPKTLTRWLSCEPYMAYDFFQTFM